MGKPIEIEVEVKPKGIQDLKNELKDLKLELEKATDSSTVNKLTKQVEDLTVEMKKTGKAVDDVQKNTNSLAKGFSAAGTALKGMGIGLVIGAMNTLKDVFMSNQKVADTFSTVMGTITNIFGQTVGVLVSVIEKVGQASGGFKGLTGVISGLMTIALTPLKGAFYGIKLVIDEVRLAWEESIFGDKDQNTIKNLTKNIEETKSTLKKVGMDAVDAGGKVVDNFGKAVNEIGSVVTGTIDGVSKISIAGAYEQAKANVQLQNTAKLAEAEQARLVEVYDRQAEKLRQIRDDDSISVKERIDANNKLGEVLSQQEKAMLAQADAQIASARATLAANNNIENKVALTNALANKEGVLAQIEGFRSEQLVNKNSLEKESIALTQTAIDASAKRAIENNKFTASLIKDTTDRLEAERKAILEEAKLEEDRLTKKRDTYAKGTQAYVDAQQEILDLQQRTNQALITNQNATDEANVSENKSKWERIANDTKLSFEEREAALAEQRAIVEAKQYESDEARIVALKTISDKEKALDQEKIQSKIAVVDAIAGLTNEETALGQALLIAKQALLAQELILSIKSTLFTAKEAATKATIKGAEAGADVAAGAAKTASAAPFPANIPLIVGYGIQAASIITSVINAVKKVKGASATTTSTPAASTGTSIPTTPIVQLTGNNTQLNETSQGQARVAAQPPQQNITVTAIVSETEMTSAQNRVSTIQRSAEL